MSVENKKAFHDYEILDQYECGMSLLGWEVKALAKNTASIIGSHCKILNGEAFLIGSSIGSATGDMQRTRKLLLHKREIAKLIGKVQEKGLTLIPLKVYSKKGKFKLLVGLAKGKKEFDKRATDKKRDIENDNRRIVKSQKFA